MVESIATIGDGTGNDVATLGDNAGYCYSDSSTQDELLRSLIPDEALELAKQDIQRAIPAIAQNMKITKKIEEALKKIPTHHDLRLGDCRDLASIPDDSVHLALTSPPYWTLKEYVGSKGQLGDVADYDEFLEELDKVWEHVFRVLTPGGRLIVVVGDVCLSRRRFGRHVVFPLHASIQEHCRTIGFDNLTPIIWHKITNAKFEVSGGSSFLGKPYEPNAIIKNDIEFILFQRKSGGYRKPSVEKKLLSVISRENHQLWFQQIWNLSGASTRDHPAPFPVALAERLIRMFSFAGDTVLDPFLGSGTTSVAAIKCGRNSIGIELEKKYFALAQSKIEKARKNQYRLPI